MGYLQNETISRQQHELKQNEDIIRVRTAMYLIGRSFTDICLIGFYWGHLYA